MLFTIDTPQVRDLPADPHNHPVLSTSPYTTFATLGTSKIVRTVNAPGRAPEADIVTTIPDAAVTGETARLMTLLVSTPAAELATLATHAAGQAIDLPRLWRHILTTGDDPWRLEQGATTQLARLARLLDGVAAPVRRAVTDPVLAVLDCFGPVLVPARVTYWDKSDEEVVETFDISRMLSRADTGESPCPSLAELSWIDAAAQACYDDCGKPDGDEDWTLSDLSLRAFHRWQVIHGLTR